MSRDHPIGREVDYWLTLVSDWMFWIFVRSCRGKTRKGAHRIACSNRRRESAEHASRTHLIKGNGNPRHCRLLWGGGSANDRQP